MRLIKTLLLSAAIAVGAGSVLAQEGIDDPTRAPYYDSFKGKRVAYVPVAIGCTGGQHRSVYLAECLARDFQTDARVLVRHRAMSPK